MTKRIILAVTMFLLAAGMSLAMTSCNNNSGKSAAQDGTPNLKPTPAVADAELLDAILSNYKGKVVLVDLWATWCGPCRRGMKILEPLKPERLKDVAFVYITSDTSPKEDFDKMAPGIHGDHYYLSQQQLGQIFTQIGSNAYPTYLIVAKDGTYGKPVIGLRDFENDVVKVLEKELAK